MKKNILLGIAIIASLTLTGCKSSKQSSYREQYLKAQAQEQNKQEETTPVAVTPVNTPATNNTAAQDNSDLRSERLEVMDNGTLKAFNVVCGSFKSVDNANNLRNSLVAKGYNAQVAQNPETGMYRVIATSFDDRASAVNSRNDLQSSYKDAWILVRKY